MKSHPDLRLPGGVDSNSPAVWDLIDGRSRLSIMTSVSGQPSLAEGSSPTQMGPAVPVSFVNHPGRGVCMEDVRGGATGSSRI